ncbi:MAG: protein-export chaperone SecB [Magnetococcales bacterium]|nr:protein-export chaperone SecB [Magnetococcales bacterium]
MSAEEDETTPPSQQEQSAFHVEKLYLKDLSFESPHAPEIFTEDLEPELEFNLETNSTRKGEEHYETALHVSVKVSSPEKVLFLVELTFAGLFLLRRIPPQHVPPLLGIECPNILFPYVRRIVSDMVLEGGFKPVVLDPVNFAALYQRKLQMRREQADDEPES